MRAFDQLGTPLVRLARFAPSVTMYGKAEFMLPTGSTYDRIAPRMLSATEGAVVVAGSGSPLLAFASVATAAKRPLTAVLPADVLPEHLNLLRRYPIEVELVDGPLEATARPGALFGPDVIEPVAAAFEATLGAELRATIEVGRPVRLVAPVLNGGLLIGCKRALEVAGHTVCTVGILRPADGRFLEGVALAAPPGVDETVVVTTAEAHETRLALARTEGVLVGMGAAAAARVAATGPADEQVVAVLVDAGDRYFSVDRKMKG